MSDAEATPSKHLPWTEEAKTQLLLRIIAQLRGDGKTINWTRLQMEGRTTKSLKNQWTKITKEISEIENAENGENGPDTPTRLKATPRKARAKKADKSETIVAPGASDENDAAEVKATPKKRGAASGRGGAKGSGKRAKRADSDSEVPKKEEGSDNDE